MFDRTMGVLSGFRTHSQTLVALYSALCGLFLVLFIYGFRLLDPTDISWLIEYYEGGDTSTGFIGWQFFRYDSWSFPLGKGYSYMYPVSTSVVYSDSIPILAIVFKLFSAVLPAGFHYFGLWMLASYALQGYFGALLIRRFTPNVSLIVIGSLFFVLSPTLVARSAVLIPQQHLALCGHWVVLASLLLYFEGEGRASKIKWTALLAFVAMVHFYLFVMVAVVFFAYIAKNFIGNGITLKNLARQAVFALASMLVVLFCMWVVGYFVVPIESSASIGFGIFSMNLLSPLNSQGLTTFPLTFLEDEIGQYEGYQYLGFGAIAMIGIASYLVVKNRKTFNLKKHHLPLLAVLLILTLWAISNRVTWGGSVLFLCPLPKFIENLVSICRSSGRMFWPVNYMLLLTAIAIIIKTNKAKQIILIISACAALQLVDLLPWYKSLTPDLMAWRWSYPKIERTATNPLSSPKWDKLLEDPEIKHVVTIPPKFMDYIRFGVLASKHQKTVNIAYINRFDTKKYTENIRETTQNFINEKYEDDTFYVVEDVGFLPSYKHPKFSGGVIDGYPVLFPKTDKNRDVVLPKPSLSANRYANAYTLQSLIKTHLTANHAIFISMKNANPQNLPLDFVALMKQIGSQIETLKMGDNYISIIANGGVALEQIKPSAVEAAFVGPLTYEGKIYSTILKSSKDLMEIKIDGIPLHVSEFGINIALIDFTNENFQRYNFDTDKTYNPTEMLK